MMIRQAQESLQPEKEYFIGFDSDGSVFDSMEIKQQECFCPAFINIYNLQGVAKTAREVWNFVNLYSKSRGINRFQAVLRATDLLRSRKELTERRVLCPDTDGLRAWTERETKLSEASLSLEVRRNPHPHLRQALGWSKEVGEAIKKIVRNVPPYPIVPEILSEAERKADLMVVSQTPGADLEREWVEYDIAKYVRLIAGQERGTKSEQLELASAGKYDKNKILMIGDAPGDLAAAQSNGVLFYPIIPGAEERSWERFLDEGLARFFSGEFSENFCNNLLADFDAALPESAPWQSGRAR